MDEIYRHEMVLDTRGDNGVDAYACPICGRIIVINPNHYKKMVLVEGDPTAAHAIVKGGMSLGEVLVKEVGER